MTAMVSGRVIDASTPQSENAYLLMEVTESVIVMDVNAQHEKIQGC